MARSRPFWTVLCQQFVYLFMFSAISSPVLYLINPEYHPFMPLVHLFASLYYSITIFFIYFVLCAFIRCFHYLSFCHHSFSLEGSLTLSKITGEKLPCVMWKWLQGSFGVYVQLTRPVRRGQSQRLYW